jgi:arginyl-tRNA synthetase
MKETLARLIRTAILRANDDELLGEVPEEALSQPIILDVPARAAHGDFSTNAALILASAARRKPREVAQAIAERMPLTEAPGLFRKVEVAGPGFINIFVEPAYWQGLVEQVLREGENYGKSRLGAGQRVQVEFVSANPTGPLHVGHGRGAALGDTLANVLAAAGYDVQREYYINDVGLQMDTLGRSTYLRYLELFGRQIEFPPKYYQGDYIKDIAAMARERWGGEYLDAPEESWLPPFRELASSEIMAGIKRDLDDFGVGYDRYFPEHDLHESGEVERAFEELRERGFLYEDEGALWFRTTALGDDKDRVVKRSTGEKTYFASDIAYHRNKFNRGFDRIVDIWGADHHGYVPRIMAAAEAFGYGKGRLQVILVQLVNLLRGGQQIAMSTRAGQFETLRDVMDEVGRDAARFIFLTRRSDAPLDFDLELVKRQSSENPVYYVQYAYARLCSVFRTAAEREVEMALNADFSLLKLDEELALIKRLAVYPDVVEGAAYFLEPHRLSYFLTQLAATFHAYYNKHRILSEEPGLTQARLHLAAALKLVFGSALRLLSVSAPERM